MEYSSIMTDAIRIFNDRNPKYGDMRLGMEKVASIATIITGIHLTPHDIALVLHAVKLSRLNADRANPEHYVDGINYFAFAGELISNDDPYGVGAAVEQSIDDEGVTEMAAKLSPMNPDTPPQGF